MDAFASLSEDATAATQPYEDTENRGMRLFWAQVVGLILPMIFVLLRAYTRFFISKAVGLDDWLMFFAMALYIAYGAIAIYGVTNGATGKHISAIEVPKAVVSLRSWYLCEVLYSPVAVAVRTSICLHLLRIATERVYRWIIYANLAVIWGISIAYLFVMMFQCSPPSYFWEQLLGKEGKCVGVNVVPDATIAHATISAVSDWCIGLLPVPLLWHVKLNLRTKVTVAVLLSMGIIAGVALMIRIPYLKRLAISGDFLYETVDVAAWSVIEPALGMIAGCAATLRPLFRNWGVGWGSTAKSSRGHPSGFGASAVGTGGGQRYSKRVSSAATKLSLTGRSKEISPFDKLSSGHRGILDEESPAGSDIELNRAVGPGHRGASYGSSWDVERGVPMRPSSRDAPITVHTCIDIMSEERDEDYVRSGRQPRRIDSQEQPLPRPEPTVMRMY